MQLNPSTNLIRQSTSFINQLWQLMNPPLPLTRWSSRSVQERMMRAWKERLPSSRIWFVKVLLDPYTAISPAATTDHLIPDKVSISTADYGWGSGSYLSLWCGPGSCLSIWSGSWCFFFKAVLRIRIRDPGLRAFLTPGSGIRDGRKLASGSGIRDEQPGSYFLELRNHFLPFLGLKYLNSLMRIRDPGWRQFGSGIRDGKKSDPGSGINIPDPQHCLKESTLYENSYYRKE